MPFPERLRELRRAAGLSQRALAGQVGIGFTYLSKIENGRVEPPSERVLLRIAKELAFRLGKDEIALADELITLAGKIPSDLAEILSRNPGVVRLLRSVGSDVHPATDWKKLLVGLTDVHDIEPELDTPNPRTNRQGLGNSLESYDEMTFKEPLAAAPLEGVDLTRTQDLPRGMEF